MIWTRQAPFPSHTYRAVLQLSHALDENKLPLALSHGWRTILSLACSTPGQRGLAGSSLLALGQPHRAGGWEWQQQGGLWAADPLWAGTEPHRSGSAGTKWGQTAPAEMMALSVVRGNCSRLGLKGRELLSAVGGSECLAVRGYLWKGWPALAGARIQAHSHPVGQWHCWAAAEVIQRGCFDTHLVSYTCGTIHVVGCQESGSAKKLLLINAISHFLHSV